MNNIPPEMQKWVDIFLSNGGIWIYLIVTGIMFFEYIFPPTPGDVVIFSAGFLSGEGGASLIIVLLCAYVGSAIGLTIVYFVGIKYGRRIIDSGRLKFINHRTLEKTESLYGRSGGKLLLISKFLPGIRFALVFFSGLANLDFKKVYVFTSISCIIWNSMIILLAYFLQQRIDIILKALSTYSTVVFIILVAVLIGWIVWKVFRWRRPV